MGDGSITKVEGLGLKSVDSHELRMKQRSIFNSRSTPSSVQNPKTGVSGSSMAATRKVSDLSPDIRDAPENASSLQQSPNPSFVQSNPLRSKSGSNNSNLAAKYAQIHNSSGTPSLIDHNPNLPANPNPKNLSTKDPNPTSGAPSASASNPQGTAPSELKFGPHSPSFSGSSPSRMLQRVFQEEGDRLDSAERLASLVNSIEGEMHNSGVNVSFSKFKDHLLQLQEAGNNLPPFDIDGEFVSVQNEQVPVHPLDPRATDSTKDVKQPPQGPQTKNWSSLFKAQAPSKIMKLEHYPEVHRGKDAHVSFEEEQLEDGIGKHCLIGNFLDGRMPIPLLTATARAVWKDHGKFSIKQMGSCYLFEFENEASKLAVLEGGPYFFSRIYLVLKEWTRMLVPGKNHPPTIPVWIKLHKLPFEFWNHIGFSKIASAIGKPIHVDEATANKRRLDFARICVEISAGDELPSDITISVNTNSIMVGVEYQWLPPKCDNCLVFGHTCAPKAALKPTSSGDEWVVVGKGKPTSTTLQDASQVTAAALPKQMEVTSCSLTAGPDSTKPSETPPPSTPPTSGNPLQF